MKNLGLKIFALFVALGMSYFVNSENNSSILKLYVPIELKNLPDHKILTSSLSSGAEVTIKGPSHLARQVMSSSPTFKLRLPEDVPNKYKTKLKEGDMALPDAVDVLSIIPAEIEVELTDKVVKENLPVIVRQIGELEPGLSLINITIDPPSVRLIGPATEISAIKEVETEPIDLSKVHGNTSIVRELKSPGNLSSLSVERVTVDLRISATQDERKLARIPVEVRSASGASYAISPRTVDVSVSGPRKLLREIQKEQVVPYIRTRPGLAMGEELEVGVDLPRNLTLIKVDPGKVKIVGVITSDQDGSAAAVQ